jgi:hypothetical protein
MFVQCYFVHRINCTNDYVKFCWLIKEWANACTDQCFDAYKLLNYQNNICSDAFTGNCSDACINNYSDGCTVDYSDDFTDTCSNAPNVKHSNGCSSFWTYKCTVLMKVTKLARFVRQNDKFAIINLLMRVHVDVPLIICWFF